MSRKPSTRHRRALGAGAALVLLVAPVSVAGPAGAGEPVVGHGVAGSVFQDGAIAASGGTGQVAAQIEPTVVTSFDTSAAGGGARPLLGDVTGDGRLDVVMMQPHYTADDRYEGALVAALTAYDLDGTRLWQAGTVDPRGRNNGSDIPAQVHDVDGDGDNEVVAIMHPGGDTTVEGRFMIFDGRTGQLVRDFALPDRLAHDAIIFANLSGGNTAREIVLKDRYDTAWALDNQGAVLWTHPGNTGHYPWPYDFTGDGRQEIMVGYDMLSPDGELLWRHQGDGHADTMWMADITGNEELELMLGGDAAVAHDGRTGAEIWRNGDIVETQNIMTGDYLPERPGLESLGLDRIDRSANGYDGLFLLDVNGQHVWREARETRGCWGSIPEPIHNWTGDYSDLIMVWNRGCGEPTTIMNGAGDVISTLDSTARLWHADFCGDDREEVVEYIQGRSLTIKSNGPCDLAAKLTGHPLPQAKRLYNYTRYTAGDSPVTLSGGRPTGTTSALAGQPGGLAVDGDPATAWRAATGDTGQSWQVDLGRWYTLTGIELTFPATDLRNACTRTVTGRHAGPLTVLAGVTCLDRATVTGPVTVLPGAALAATDATIGGPLSALGARAVQVTGSRIGGAVSLVGGTGRLVLTGNQLTGPVSLVGNRTGSAPVVVSDNAVPGVLACVGNQPAPVRGGEPNTVGVLAAGQCADIPAGDPHGTEFRYGYVVETSTDAQNWVRVLDRTDNDLTAATQQALFTGLGRHVRVTFTDLPEVPYARAGLAEVAVRGNR
ncbi:discoidin domain-containing protein [Plantactinospora solaniradicis]|uniref:Discoidin domain-containing protein n=1 Tax=Plantactinospora solaniradicis TaxID=1723736 RepID=A0ABW1KAD5_9ACTN